MDYERAYLQTDVDVPRSLAFLVHDGNALVGATTALPMVDEETAFSRPLADADFDMQRETEHPLRGANYEPLDRFWSKSGYVRRYDISAVYRWQDIDRPTPTDKRLTFWIRALEQRPDTSAL